MLGHVTHVNAAVPTARPVAASPALPPAAEIDPGSTPSSSSSLATDNVGA